MASSKLKYYIPSFSLVEVIVAMVILLTIFFIGIYFFASVHQQGFNLQQKTAENILDEYVNKSKLDKDFSVERRELDGWQVGRNSEPYEEIDSMLQVSFTIYKKDSSALPFKQRILLFRVQHSANKIITVIE